MISGVNYNYIWFLIGFILGIWFSNVEIDIDEEDDEEDDFPKQEKKDKNN